MTEEDKKLWEYITKTITPLGQPSSEPQKTIYDFINFKKEFKKINPTIQKKSNTYYEAKIDLHGMTQNEAHVHLAQTLAKFKLKKYKCVLVITGKGGKYGRRQTGVLKRVVPLWLTTAKFKHLVKSIAPAKREDGGDGALYVFLK